MYNVPKEFIIISFKKSSDVFLAEIENYKNTFYEIFLLFLNTILFDFCLESYVIYHLPDQISMFSLVRRLSRQVLLASTPAVTTGLAVVYSPLVEIPGVNAFQLRFGRGYGFFCCNAYTYRWFW